MKCLSPANFNMTATREGQPLWTEAGWARRMLGTALARGWIRAGGDTPRPPLGFICSHGQAPSPAAHHCSASRPCCRCAALPRPAPPLRAHAPAAVTGAWQGQSSLFFFTCVFQQWRKGVIWEHIAEPPNLVPTTQI